MRHLRNDNNLPNQGLVSGGLKGKGGLGESRDRHDDML
ncbi:hypothetical protein D5b_00388 [Faustovirus]|nr:hypothetical protein D5b_00388 [Faustovirus]AMN84527.1 hypothetical protein D6_00118 [Faustovirus]AMP44331.1 hypothetical protein PRJ_Dakar_00379 [Faustovirus]